MGGVRLSEVPAYERCLHIGGVTVNGGLAAV